MGIIGPSGVCVSSSASLGIPIPVSHLIVVPFVPRSSLLPILFRKERQAGDVQKRNKLTNKKVTRSVKPNTSSNATSHLNWYRTHRGPDEKHDIGGLWQPIPAGDLRVLLLVPITDLIKGCGNDNKPKNRVEVVLRWAASESGFGLE